MKLFIDSAKLDETDKAIIYEILDCETTSHFLIKGATIFFKDEIENYIRIFGFTGRGKSIGFEVIGSSYDEMTCVGELLHKRFNKGVVLGYAGLLKNER